MSRKAYNSKLSLRPDEYAPVHPGDILAEDYLKPLQMSQRKFAKHVGISVPRVNEICKGKRGISVETAIIFGRAFDTGPKFWLNLQNNYDLSVATDKYDDIEPLVSVPRRA